MKRIGPHVHTTGGVQSAPLNAHALGATAFGLFTRNQRRWISKPLDQPTIDQFKSNMEETGYLPQHVLAHDSYLINLGHPGGPVHEQSNAAIIDELTRCMQLGIPCLNIHPGSHLEQISEEQCLDRIAASINHALAETAGVSVVLENTAGQGSNVGYRFEHLAYVIERIDDKKRIGVCLDTCHLFAAGYDIRTESSYHEAMGRFERIVGFKYLRGAHLNDSKSALGSRVDRHQSIGLGLLGLDTFKFLMNDNRFEEIPLILETIDDTLWPKEIEQLYGLEDSRGQG